MAFSLKQAHISAGRCQCCLNILTSFYEVEGFSTFTGQCLDLVLNFSCIFSISSDPQYVDPQDGPKETRE
jgi:hypothetical protein